MTYDYLNKTGLTELWGKIKSKFISNPNGGTSGQVLTKTETGEAWTTLSIPDIPEVLPVERGGTNCTTVDGIRTMLFDFPTEQELDEYFNL